MGRVIVIANQKGGTGKTTTAINLCASLSLAERRTLLIDMDPQGNATSGLGIRREQVSKSVYDGLLNLGSDPQELLCNALPHLDLMPSDRNLSGAEIELVTLEQRETRLKRLIEPLRGRYDFVFVDTPPSLGLLTVNALVAGDTTLIPVQTEYFALEGVSELMETLTRVQESLNPRLTIEGILLTMHDERTNLSRQVCAEVRGFFGGRVYETVIPRNIRLGECPSYGLPIVQYDIRSPGARAYLRLAEEFLKKEGRGRADENRI